MISLVLLCDRPTEITKETHRVANSEVKLTTSAKNKQIEEICVLFLIILEIIIRKVDLSPRSESS